MSDKSPELQYIPDDGFSDRVMTHILRKKRTRRRVLLLGAVLGTAAGGFLVGQFGLELSIAEIMAGDVSHILKMGYIGSLMLILGFILATEPVSD